eukprot:3639583-Amphidinium_carterae.1
MGMTAVGMGMTNWDGLPLMPNLGSDNSKGLVSHVRLRRGILHKTVLFAKLLVSRCGRCLCKGGFSGQKGTVSIQEGVLLK